MLDMTKVDLVGKRVLIREDLNVPLRDGHIVSDERIQRALPTLQYALKNKARVMVLSHLGRPQEGQPTVEYSLAPVADALSQALNQTVPLVSSYLDGLNVEPGAIVLCENVRFNRGEQANDVELSKRLAALCDVFVMDAFATAHRAQASTEGVIKYAPTACAGPLLKEELTALSAALNQPAHPLLAIVGGSKVSTKIQLLEQLLTRVDTLIVGGGIANTFLAAAGYSIGKSLYEKDWVDAAKQLLKKAQKQSVHIPLPVDLRVAETFSEKAPATVKLCDAVQANELILDVGPKTEAQYPAMMQAAKTIVWNGPVGVFEFDAFSAGTRALGNAIASSPAYSIAGGGDTIAALEKNQLSDRISYVCTGGGAFLEYLEGKTLPAVAALEERAHYAETS